RNRFASLGVGAKSFTCAETLRGPSKANPGISPGRTSRAATATAITTPRTRLRLRRTWQRDPHRRPRRRRTTASRRASSSRRRTRARRQVRDLHRRQGRGGPLQHARPAEVVEVVAGARLVPAALAEAGDRAVDGALARLLRADAEPRGDVRTERLDDDVRLRDQLL